MATATSLPPLVPGTQYGFTLRRKSGAAFVPSDHRIQFVFDSPRKYSPGLRIVKTYNPDSMVGSSGGVAASGDEVNCVLSAEDTEPMQAFPGSWSVYVTVGPADEQTVLVPKAWNMLPVHSPDGGDLFS